MTLWERCLRYPQTLWVRKAIFQIHLWVGLIVGLYVLLISASGSILVYRNELYARFSPEPLIVEGSGTPLTLEQITRAARDSHPGSDVTDVSRGDALNQAMEVTLVRDGETTLRLFDPFTGEDLGYALPAGFRFTRWLLDFHDNLLNGPAGRRVNGIGALLLLVMCLSGAVVWWPGISRWRRSLTVDRRDQRLSWRLHSAFGFWTWAFMMLWAITGSYLAFPEAYGAFFDYVEPFDENNPADRVVDRIQYWLGYLHFGRLGGRGIPGCGRGACDATTKFIWAVAGAVPPVMFVTGVLMWWNRAWKGRRRWRAARSQALLE
jgi:uncharacterized iron-regulated membrane protein